MDRSKWSPRQIKSGFRCDVARYIPISFWEESRAELERLKPDLVMVAESSRAYHLRSAFEANYNMTVIKNALLHVLFKDEKFADRGVWNMSVNATKSMLRAPACIHLRNRWSAYDFQRSGNSSWRTCLPFRP